MSDIAIIKEPSDSECSICFEKMIPEKEQIFSLGCNHFFHKTCIDSWIDTQNNNIHTIKNYNDDNIRFSCPYCRKKYIKGVKNSGYIYQVESISYFLMSIFIYIIMCLLFLFLNDNH